MISESQDIEHLHACIFSYISETATWITRNNEGIKQHKTLKAHFVLKLTALILIGKGASSFLLCFFVDIRSNIAAAAKRGVDKIDEIFRRVSYWMNYGWTNVISS